MAPSAEHDAARSADGDASPRVDYHEATNTYRAEFDQTTRLATEAIADTVARVSKADPLDLPPIYSVVDPDALDSLFAEGSIGPARIDGRVPFHYADCLVTINSHGTIEVEPVEASIQ